MFDLNGCGRVTCLELSHHRARVPLTQRYGGKPLNWDTITELLPALGGFLTVLYSLRSEGSARGRLAKDVELLDKLPEGPARQKLLNFIETQVTELTVRKKRQAGWAAFAAVSVAASIWGTLELVEVGELWAYLTALPVVFYGLVCFYGLTDSLTPKAVEDPAPASPGSVDLTGTPQPNSSTQQ